MFAIKFLKIKHMYNITMYRLHLASCSSGFCFKNVVIRSLGGTTDLVIRHLGLTCLADTSYHQMWLLLVINSRLVHLKL